MLLAKVCLAVFMQMKARWQLGIGLVLLFTVCQANVIGTCREQYQMNHPPTPPPQGLVANSGLVPKFTPDFWKGQLQRRVPAGAVLSGILEDDLSSAKSKAHDIFAIGLEDGFALNGEEVIPAGSKIVGTVLSVTSAKELRHGHPGKLEVSLKTLVLPDGRHIPFCGFIDSNPNHLSQNEPHKRYPGKSMAEYGQSLGAFFGSFTSGIGLALNRRQRGQEFKLQKGEVLPVRLSRSLDMLPLVKPADPLVPGLAGSKSPYPGPSIAPENGGIAPMSQQEPLSVPSKGLMAKQYALVPGLVGPDPDVPVVPQTSLRAPVKDLNSVFNEPIQPRPVIDFAEEPF